jgi:hypothetical protein
VVRDPEADASRTVRTNLRLASAAQRFAVLLLSMLLGVIFWSLPVFDGMMGSWEGFLVVLGLVLSVCGVLAALILAPMLVGVFTRRGPRELT